MKQIRRNSVKRERNSFITPLVVSPLPDGHHWKLVAGFTCIVDRMQIRIAPGFVTDFASVPSFLWWLIPPWGRYGKAAVIHDYNYQKHDWNIDRLRADLIFRDNMRVLKVKEWRVFLMFWAVRIFGQIAWRRDRRYLKA